MIIAREGKYPEVVLPVNKNKLKIDVTQNSIFTYKKSSR